MNQINLSKECGKNILIDSLIEFYNMNSTIITAFYENQSISVPPPLSCTKGLIIAQIQGLNSLYEEIDNNINNASVPSSCDPFFNNFKAYKDVWFEYTNQLISNTISMKYLKCLRIFTSNYFFYRHFACKSSFNFILYC